MEKRQERIQVHPEQISEQPPSFSQRKTSQRSRRLSFKEQRELESIEETILAAEDRVNALTVLLNDPQFHATRSQEAPAFIEKLEQEKKEVTRLYARWEELERIRAAQV